MPVLVTADLHLDLWLQAGRDPMATLEPGLWASLKALIIAGDLANKPRVRWPKMIAHLGRYIDPARIHVLPGNHDYYDHRIDGEDRLAAICAEARALFVQKARIVIGGTQFLCCTLWTDFALHGDPATAMQIALREMNDYRYIRHGGAAYRRLRPGDTARIHADHRLWLSRQLAMPFSGRTIAVTHHCPHPGLIGAKPAETDPAYGSDLRALISEARPAAWLFGHTHHPAEVSLDATSLRNVSLGYSWQVPPGEEAARLLRGLIEVDDDKN